ncbi:PPK2 family polyphosphate kinase [Planctomonas sp. JC2975]|uniref:PPK2 family polyphosphate kinase n=1 Tax=Planctomonas sp. JC2975 TaxID=2729626 RepID=UPI003211D398
MDPGVRLVARPRFDLSALPSDARPGFDGSRKSGKRALRGASAELAELQERLYAAGIDGDDRAVLLVLQGMDTAGKGGIVGHVVGAVNPQGVHYTAFKKPTREELAHDFLWRVRPHVPRPGIIGVFDRSHYEDVLIGRVRALASPEEIERRYAAIDEFERELVDGGTRIVKVMLHVGFDEQERRLLHRLDRPDKYWKFNPADLDERELWPEYRQAYQIAITRTSTDYAPWHVVPADHKWYARLAVQQLLIEALQDMELGWPPPRFDVDAQRERLRSLTVR